MTQSEPLYFEFLDSHGVFYIFFKDQKPNYIQTSSFTAPLTAWPDFSAHRTTYVDWPHYKSTQGDYCIIFICPDSATHLVCADGLAYLEP